MHLDLCKVRLSSRLGPVGLKMIGDFGITWPSPPSECDSGAGAAWGIEVKAEAGSTVWCDKANQQAGNRRKVERERQKATRCAES